MKILSSDSEGDLGFYKNIDKMTDKDMFAEYDKLLKSAKRIRKRLKR